MADFIDSEAEESEEEDVGHSRSKNKKVRALQSDDEEDEEEDDEDRLREELKDLIDDNPIEEDESDAESESSRKRKKSDDEDDEFDDRLEDEDFDLLEENLGVKVKRKKQFKRLKRLDDEDSEGEGETDNRDDREAIASQLFEGGSDNEEEASRTQAYDTAATERDGGEEGESEGDYSDDGFIVDDNNLPMAERRKKKKHIFNDAALQEAQDIFGVDFDFDDIGKYDDEYYDEEEDEDEYEEEGDDEIPRRRQARKPPKKKTTRKSIFEIYEPSELERGHFTDLDNEIRNTDVPERMQLRIVPVTPVAAESNELDNESEWIYKTAFDRAAISNQDPEYKERPKGPIIISKIKKALDFMRNQHLEVPFIAFYRKEYVQPEMTINDLWKVYKFDEKWCQLKQRKTNLVNLLEKMRSYQGDQIMAVHDQPLSENIRIITDEDIDRIHAVQSVDELKDVYMQFLLYYSNDVPAMQEDYKKKRKAEYDERQRVRELRRTDREERRAALAEGEELPPEDDEEIEDEEEPTMEEDPTAKHMIRSGPYQICRREGLTGFAKKFGLTPEQFGEHLRDNYMRHDVQQYPSSPLETAGEYITVCFKTPEEVLKAGKFMVSTQISRDPLVRLVVRDHFFQHASISVKPTKKGLKEIDEQHSLFSLKFLRDKPVTEIQLDQFLKLVNAEEDKLLTLQIGEYIRGLTEQEYLKEVKNLYYKDEYVQHVSQWNDVRAECLDVAFEKMLYPMFRKELKNQLVAEAKECVLQMCCRKLYSAIKVAPYSVEVAEDDEDDWDTSRGLRVMGLAYVPDYEQAAFTCLVGVDGDCTDYLRLEHIIRRKNSWRESDRVCKEADLQAIRHFISTKKPHVIVISGESREALMIQEDIKGVITTLVEDEQFPNINVELCDNELAKIYANSIKGESDFRDYPRLLRQAISLARYIQDPLVEYSQLCTGDEEILCLRYHTLQDSISKEELLDALYLEFVNRTNEVGVDINKAINMPHTSNLVQFICGLGPRKAQALIKTLKQLNQRLENRTQLVTACHMGPKVFINCAGFIKIDTNSLGDSTESYVEVLDGSRVHPETYEWARKMAVDALEYEDEEEANPAGALEEILESPDRLKDLDLDAFAEELERQGFGNKSITLYDIRNELNNRYKDMRNSFQPPNPEDVFNMLTKETPETFYIGKLVLATVISISHRKPQGEQLDNANPVRKEETGLWQCPFCLKNEFCDLSEVWNHFDAGACPGQAVGIRIRLDNGITGFISMKNLSDQHVTNPEERVRVGQSIHCRIIKIDVERFQVDCSSKTSDLLDLNEEWKPPLDQCYDKGLAKELDEEDKRAKEKHKRQTYTKRVIVHSSFQNISFKEAVDKMANFDQGDAIIRPSSKGPNHLTVTWKVCEDILQHIDILEEKKEKDFSLGQLLKIGDEEFEDLDEIIARYINPMGAFVRDIMSFKYYKPDVTSREVASAQLKEDKQRNPNKIPYILCPSKDYPGKFMLSYIPRVNARHEFMTVTHEGFRFRSQMFETLNSLFRWFKEHFRDPIPGTPHMSTGTPRMGNMSTRTPYMTGGITPAGGISNMNADAIHRVAQSIPSHMLHSLSQVASHTPHFGHTPGYTGGGGYSSYTANTPYTPSGQTPFMTPYHSANTPSHHNFAHPSSATPSGRHTPGGNRPHHTTSTTPGANRTPRQGNTTPSEERPQHQQSKSGTETTDWQKAAEMWARSRQKQPDATFRSPKYSGQTTPRDDNRRPRNRYEGHHGASPRGYVDHDRPRTSSYMPSPSLHHGKSPRTPRSVRETHSTRSTPRTIASPRSMVESSISGDATPLYDEN